MSFEDFPADALPPSKLVTTRVVAMPSETNPSGDIFGGWIMSQVDLAGSVVAAQKANGRIVTVAVNSFQFHQPVFVGDLVSFYAEIEKIGRTSITVNVIVYAERGGLKLETVKVTQATVVYVAIDANRQPRVIMQ